MVWIAQSQSQNIRGLASATFTRLYDFLGFLIAKSATNVE